TDGRYALCTLDRNGLRPARFCITANRCLTIASETGVWDYAPEDVVRKGKLGPGDMIALDLKSGTLLASADIDQILKSRHPYKSWLKQGVRYLESDLVDARLAAAPMDRDTLALYQKMFNVTQEERDEIIRVLAEDENEAVGSMGDDTPMPVLSHKVRPLYDYFRQQFAQVTNPPIDSLRESIVMSLQTQIGPECNIFLPAPEHARQIVLGSPILSQRKLRQILAIEEVTHEFIDLQYDPAEGLRRAILRMCAQAESAVLEGKLVLLLSDRYLVRGRTPAHALLLTGAVLPQLAAVRDRRARGRGGGPVLYRHRKPRAGRGFRRSRSRPRSARRARLEPARGDRPGRASQVHARRRVPHVQPRRDRGASGGGDLRR